MTIKLNLTNNKKLYCFASILVGIYIFFPFFKFRNLSALLGTVIFLLLSLTSYKSFRIAKGTEIMFLITILYSYLVTAISRVNGNAGEIGSSIGLGFIICFGVYYIHNRIHIENKLFLVILVVFSVFFMIATYLQFSGVQSLQQFVYRYINSQESIEDYMAAQSWGSYYGLASTNFENAFFISISSAFFFAYSFKTQRKWIPVVLYAVSIGAIMLSGKRSILIANALVVITCLLTMRRDKMNVKTVVRVLMIAVVLIGVIEYINYKTNVFKLLIDKSATTATLLNGREDIYSSLLSSMNGYWIFGHGLGSTYTVYSQGAHNIYIQLLYELGIVGVCLFVLFFIHKLKKAYVLMRQDADDNRCIVSISCFYLQLLFLIYGLSGNPLFYNSSLLIYFIAVSIVEGIFDNMSRMNDELGSLL